MAVVLLNNMFVSLLTILIGVLILAFPGLLRALVGGYFVLVGVLMLFAQVI